MKRFICIFPAILLTALLFASIGCAGVNGRPSGASSFGTWRSVCPQCGGTGQFYQPNLFFDGTFWQGGYIACPGCGGSGYLS